MFETPYQFTVMDLIEQHLSELHEGRAQGILERHDDKYWVKETWCEVGIQWDLCPKQDLVEIVEVG